MAPWDWKLQSVPFLLSPPSMSLHPIVSNRSLRSKKTKLRIDSGLISSFFPNLNFSLLSPKTFAYADAANSPQL